ncbi:hypothetical protein [Nitritalea halalkaliphila]|uniref:hypothetical protein n=1 Tax=Nitritalea halalkaliphila TaxID=590849 RepID=UPI000301F70C|nr:hypothetical protein [Nitritalea halalkaliphila]
MIVTFFLLGRVAQSQILNIEQYRLAKDTSKSVMMKLNAGLNVFNRSAAADAP